MDGYVRLDTLLYILAAIAALAAIIWIVVHRNFGRSILDMTLKIDREKEKYREMKQQMSNNIAHELRTPVSSIRGYLETLTTCPDIDPARKQIFIERAYAQSIRLSDLIRDIALITKIEEASSQLVKEKINVREIMAEVLEEFKDKIADKGINIENMLPPDLEIEANRTLVFAIFRNLVENSLKYAGDHITIHIECSGRKSDLYQFKYYDTICRQVANRLPNIKAFASGHDYIYFVAGRKSSNGKMLYEECKKANPNSIFISDADEIIAPLPVGVKSVGVCGAASTPKWLMEQVAEKVRRLNGDR